MAIRSLGLLLIAVSILVGCGEEKNTSDGGPGGTPIPTSAFDLDVDIRADGHENVVVTATLDDGTELGDYYVLSGGDMLRACVGSHCRKLNKSHDFELFSQEYKRKIRYREDTDYVILLEREDEVDALDTVVQVPPPFDLLSPRNHRKLMPGEMLDIMWSTPPPGAKVRIMTEGRCKKVGSKHKTHFERNYPDADPDEDDTATFAVEDLIELPSEPVRWCKFELRVMQYYTGTVDPAVASGTVVGRFVRRRQLRYVP